MPRSPLGHYMVMIWELLKQSVAEVTWASYVRAWEEWCKVVRGQQLSECKCESSRRYCLVVTCVKRAWHMVACARVWWVSLSF